MLISEKLEKIIKIIIFTGLLILVGIIFSQKINFTNIDLGRHLENGKIVWENPQILFQNFYSYTEPDFRFINHHWLSGLIFYKIYLIGGFKLLSIFNLLIALITFLLFFKLSNKKSNFYLSAAISLPVIFLLSERVEIRPEIFSYLFIILTWLLIEKIANNKIWRRLLLFIPIFILWANLHIYFFIGLALIGFKMLAEFLPLLFIKTENIKDQIKLAWLKAKPWAKALFLSFLACLVTPNTWRGLLYPFNIFQNYGYEIAENKTIFYLSHLTINPNFYLFKIILILLLLSWLIYFLFYKKLRLFDFFIGLFFSFLALFASRNLTIFGLTALILIPANLHKPWKYLNNTPLISRLINLDKIKPYLLGFFGLLIVIISCYLVIDSRSYNNIIKNPLGFDLLPKNSDSATFFKENQLSGPVFNNYDIGSALIFWLFPQEKVFVDNRPEAYSNKFFKETYIPLQNDDKKWEELNNYYKFKTIYFSHTDGTPWAQQFLKRILSDNNWSIIYFDSYTVILANKKLNNTDLINKLTIDTKTEFFRNHLRSLVTDSNLKNKMSLASFAEKTNQSILAEEIYRGILIKYPNYNEALVSLGSIYANSQDRSQLIKSLKYFEDSLASGYLLPEIYNQIGLVNWQLNEYQKAETAWVSALKLERKNISALYYLNQINDLKKSGKLPISW